jgi:IclR family acetate operon transcriptional repressor
LKRLPPTDNSFRTTQGFSMKDPKKPGKRTSAPARDDSGPRSLTRLLALFDALSLAPNGMTLADLNVALESPKSSLLNLLRPLVAEGFLVHSAGTYNLGPSIFRLSAGVLSASTTTKVIRPFLIELVERTGESAMWGVLNREVGEVTFTDVVDSPHPLRLQIPGGVRRPLYASPTGWVLLAYADKTWREQYISSMVTTVATSAPITRALLLREFAKVRAEGTLASIDVPVAGLGSVSAPVFDAKGECVGAVNVAGPSNRFHANVAALRVAVKQIAARASAQLSEAIDPAPPAVR